ncbi:uncharacterized protein LOC111024145 [Momordica charantia]|uniref:Uncharacterized protein LOC111024145 n=1 Tax=Momordica charantia TaxID=3673 RepID=A0A6J1DWI4_MOMCH|nr:uncharacterized protein LOC111024145 [Momordica charantia]
MVDCTLVKVVSGIPVRMHAHTDGIYFQCKCLIQTYLYFSTSTSIIALLAAEKFNSENYTQWKTNLNTILVVDDLRFILTEECPQAPTPNAARASRDAYDRWIKANDKANVYILTSISDVLSKKHESMVTAREIMDSLQDIFRQLSIQARHDALKFI